MKKMTTVLTLIALTLTLSTMAFGQNGKRNQHGMQGGLPPGRQAARTGNNAESSVVYVGGSTRQRNNANGNYSFSLGPNAQQQNQAARPDNLTLNGSGLAGSGALRSVKAKRQSNANKPNQITHTYDSDLRAAKTTSASSQLTGNHTNSRSLLGIAFDPVRRGQSTNRR